MAQAATITVNDRAATPVAHAFKPRDVDTGIAIFAESASVPLGDKIITLRWRKAENGRRYCRLMLTSPTLVDELINGVVVPKVVRTALVDATFRFDGTSTAQERMNTIGMFANALASSQALVMSTLVDFEGVW
jgi:hypothetical protein